MSLALALVSDEEAGSKYGVIPLIEKGVIKARDLALVPDTGCPDGSEIEIAEKSILWLKITTKGKQVHGSLPQQGLNAYRVGMRMALEIDGLLHKKYSGTDSLFDPPLSTFEPTKHELNVENINTVPGLDVQYFDCRVLPRYSLTDVVKDFDSVKVKLEKETGAKIELAALQCEQNTVPSSIDSEVPNRVRTALKKLRGLDARAVGIGGGTVALYFRRNGLDTAVWSTIDDMAHQPNEYCRIDNIVNDAKVFVHVVLS